MSTRGNPLGSFYTRSAYEFVYLRFHNKGVYVRMSLSKMVSKGNLTDFPRIVRLEVRRFSYLAIFPKRKFPISVTERKRDCQAIWKALSY